MSDFFSGHVLRPIRTAPSNALSTSDPINGVLKSVRFVEPNGPVGLSSVPTDTPVEPFRDKYRASILAHEDTEEYLIWAANSSNMSIREGQEVREGTFEIPVGERSVGAYTDGTDRFILLDEGNRDIASILSMTYVRGDDSSETPITTSHVELTSVKGVVSITDSSDYLSVDRGDRIVDAVYTLSASRFWWTRNDKYQTRFGWDGARQRWIPLVGSSVVDAGVVSVEGSYSLSPKPSGLSLGQILPGNGGDFDSYSMIRVGSNAGVSSYPLGPDLSIDSVEFAGVKVVLDDEVESYDFSADSPQYAGVISLEEGYLHLNPAFAAATTGLNIWYSPTTFTSGSGIVAPLSEAFDRDLYISPVPGPTERPIVSLGEREPLVSIVLDSDSLLDAFSPSEGEVGVSRSTGRLKFSEVDVQKARTGTREAPNSLFKVSFYGTNVRYLGVTCNTIAQPLRREVPLVDSLGAVVEDPASNEDLYLSLASVEYPLGSSGVHLIPDESGSVPNANSVPNVRPNASGLVRDVSSLGDLILFGDGGAVDTIRVVDYVSDVPKQKNISGGEAYIARESVGGRSLVRINQRDMKQKFSTGSVYFKQADLTPSVYAQGPILWTRRRFSFHLEGNEELHLLVDGSSYVSWHASSLGEGVFSAEAVAESLSEELPDITIRVSNGHIGLQATTSIEVLYGSFTPILHKDLSGSSALGLLPGWYAESAGSGSADDLNWNPDNGSSIGMFRTPANRDRSQNVADFQTTGRFEDVLVSEIGPSPVQFLDIPPLEDHVGYEEGVFFAIQDGLSERKLLPFRDILHSFGERRVSYLQSSETSSVIDKATSTLRLGPQLVPETLSHTVDGYVQVSADGSEVSYLGEDEYAVDSISGNLQLIESVRPLLLRSSRGSSTIANPDTIQDLTQNFPASGIVSGNRLKVVSGDVKGWYVIGEVSTDALTVIPDLPLVEDTDLISYEVYEAGSSSGRDLGIVADVQFSTWSHLPDEVFKIKVLTKVGKAGATLACDPSLIIPTGNEVGLRFGSDIGSYTAEIHILRRETLGVLVREGLALPEWSSEDDLYSIRVGSTIFTPTSVVAFSADPVTVECRISDRTLKFSTAIITDYAGSSVLYMERLLAEGALSAGQAQLDPSSGEIRISESDSNLYQGSDIFLDVLLKAEGTDAVISPLSGSLGLLRPLKEGQILEVAYYVADGSGEKALDDQGLEIQVTEQLPVFVRLEEASRVSDRVFSFNPSGRTVYSNMSPIVYVGNTQANYGTNRSAQIDLDASTITFDTSVDPSDEVRVTYAVMEALGGETSYSTSARPVWRPPFYVTGPTSTFEVSGDQRAAFPQGALLRVGSSLFFVLETEFLSNRTKVSFHPPLVSGQEIGSRSPGNDTLQLVTASLTEAEGFFLSLDDLLPAASLQGVAKGQSEVMIMGDVSEYLVSGHCLTLDGDPFLVTGVSLDSEGRATRISLGSATIKEYYEDAELLLSARPVYPENARVFLFSGPIRQDSPYEVIRYGDVSTGGGVLPGRTLVRDRDYRLDGSGLIELLPLYEKALQKGQRLEMVYTRVSELKPFIVDGGVIQPRYKAKYSSLVSPSSDNRILGRRLLAKYSYHAPDSFYMQIKPLLDYVGDVADELNSTLSDSGQGKTPTTLKSSDLSVQGSLGLLSQEMDLFQKDLAARRVLAFYNAAVEYLEQIQEVSQGGFVGDRDGKFRFFIGRGLDWPTPGYEDDVSGELIERNVWAQIFNAEAPDEIKFLPEDYIVLPSSASLDGEEVEGEYLDPDIFREYLNLQRFYIKNDVDDVVLISRSRSQIRSGLLGFPKLLARGKFSKTGEPSQLSRLYPEQSKVFTILSPGMGWDESSGDPGRYTAGRFLGGKNRRTRGSVIGTLSNPVLGVVEDIQSVEARKRSARARIWAYSPIGFPELDSIPEFSTDFAANPRPAIIAIPVPLEEVLIDENTLLPEASQFISASGDVPDLTTGDYTLSTPAFNVGDPLGFGRPDGSFFEVGYKVKSFSFGLSGFGTSTRIASVYVDRIYGGCCMTLRYEPSGGAVTVPSQLVEKSSDIDGIELVLRQGDTVFVGEPSGTDQEISDPPTLSELEQFSEASSDYRSGFDVRFTRSGNIVDNTLPSFRDPRLFGLKELRGQNPPKPLSAFEAEVDFGNTRTLPLEIPALRGEFKDDSGDYSLPYLSGPGSEMILLRQSQFAISEIVRSEISGSAEYPDELYTDDGVISPVATALVPSATLNTSLDLTPTHEEGDGVGPLRSYDFFLVETGGSLPEASSGLLSVGSVSEHGILPPRFVTESASGQNIKYTLQRAMVWVDYPTYSTGLLFSQTVGASVFTYLDVSSTSIVLDDGSGGGSSFPYTGGFNDYFASATSGATVVFNVFKQPDDPTTAIDEGEVALSIVVEKVGVGYTVDCGLGPVAVLDLYFETNRLVVETASPWLDFTEVALGIYHDFYVDVDTGSGTSTTEYVDSDRLTFRTTYDLSTAQNRGKTHPASFLSVETRLAVSEVETPLGASAVNSPAEVNGGVPFTFIPYEFGGSIGSFSSGVGSIRVMAFEGHSNTPIVASDVVFAGIPSSDILSGVGSASNDAVTGIDSSTDLSLILPGDVLVISRSDGAAYATEKAGTYLIRYAVPTNNASSTRDEVLVPSTGGTGVGWLGLPFPTSSDFNVSTGVLTLSSEEGFEVGQRAYLLVNPSAVSSTEVSDYAQTCYSGEILSLSPMTLDMSTLVDAAGVAVDAADFKSVADEGVRVSGFTVLPVDADHPTYPYVPGVVTSVLVENFATGVSGSAVPDGTTSSGAAGDYGVYPPTGYPYAGYANQVTISDTPPSTVWSDLWDTLHDPNGFGGDGVPRCILPNDLLTADYEIEAGIYLEPSTPRPTSNLSTTGPRVVTSSHSLSVSERGFRSASTSEDVLWSVRRIRRFSPILSQLTSALTPLRYAYEIRRGVITGFSTTDSGNSVEALEGTQLGLFDSDEVNVHVGDTFRVCNADGTVKYEREILSVQSTGLGLRGPVIYEDLTGEGFEIFLRRAPVPHEQSNQQILDLITDREIYRRTCDYGSQSGGFVDDVNVLSDTDPSVDFVAMGVQEGDVLIIDPAGWVEGPGGPASIPERGSAPLGNSGLPPYEVGDEGGPSPLDDNRGYYLVESVTPSEVTVKAMGYFAGDSTSGNVLLGDAEFPYVLYPVITDSELTGGAEGQMDLRETAFANGSNSFALDSRSIAPFSYRIIRPTDAFEVETVAFALMLRERTLSWIESVQMFSNGKSGSYEVFQRDGHVESVERPGAPDTGLGVPSNEFILGIEGEVGTYPFENSRKCLSILDRRFFLGDTSLDSDGYSDFLNDGGRPVLPDYVDSILNQTENLRKIRYAWLTYRSDLTDGTLQSIRRFRENLENRKGQQNRAFTMKKSIS